MPVLLRFVRAEQGEDEAVCLSTSDLDLRFTMYTVMCTCGHYCRLTDTHIHDMQLRWLAYAVLPYHCVLWCMWRFS